MAEYIDIDTPLELYVERGGFYEKQISKLRDLLDTNRIPYKTADVRPVVRGKWISGDARNVTAVCSNCGRLRLGNGAESATKYAPFCEKCGADMREES